MFNRTGNSTDATENSPFFQEDEKYTYRIIIRPARPLNNKQANVKPRTAKKHESQGQADKGYHSHGHS